MLHYLQLFSGRGVRLPHHLWLLAASIRDCDWRTSPVILAGGETCWSFLQPLLLQRWRPHPWTAQTWASWRHNKGFEEGRQDGYLYPQGRRAQDASLPSRASLCSASPNTGKWRMPSGLCGWVGGGPELRQQQGDSWKQGFGKAPTLLADENLVLLWVDTVMLGGSVNGTQHYEEETRWVLKRTCRCVYKWI